MGRPSGTKNKPKADKPKVKPAKPPKAKGGKKGAAAAKAGPAPAAAVAEAGKAGQARRVITQNNLKSLMRSVASFKAEADSSNGSLREKIAYAVEHHHLDKGVFSLIRRLDKMEPEKLLIFLENLEHYLDVSGLNDRADSVGKLPLGEQAEDGDGDDAGDGEGDGAEDGPPTTIKPAEGGEVSQPQGVKVGQAPGGTVHMLPDRKPAAAAG